MWSNGDHRIVIFPPGKGFHTPSPTSSSDLKASSPNPSSPSPMSDPRRRSPANGGNLFHVIHKVPAGNSPYVRAKHVQLIEKDPSRAISLFWSAINAGDRVDSALKDMAIVMKQLNRSDEAIEAIKSFRHLCPHDSQESLDNVLVELYKRAGRTEEEIEMLQNKLMRIEEGLAFGGRRTKTARSQGKKVHITMEEEKSRILGNLAWAYLQQNNYGAAEEFYRRALAFEPDKNKECNLAICLMHMNRLAEARSLLHAVKASCGRNLMDESFAKSYERACEMLADFEAGSASELSVSDGNCSRGLISPQIGNSDRDMQQHREFYRGSDFKSRIPVSQEMRSPCPPYGRGGGLRYPRQCPVNNESRNGCFEEIPSERRSGFHGGRKLFQSGIVATEPRGLSRRRSIHCSPAPTWGKARPPFTQPRRCLWGYGDGSGSQRNVEMSIPEQKFPSCEDWGTRRSWENGDPRKSTSEERNSNQGLPSSESRKSPVSTETRDPTADPSNCRQKKSWADMAEEEDEEFFNDCEKFKFNESPRLQTQTRNGNSGNRNFEFYDNRNAEEEEFADENVNINIQMKEGVVRKLDLFNLRDNVQPEKRDASPRNQPVKRSLCFDRNKNPANCNAGKSFTLLRRNRLKVFEDITRTP